MTKDKKLDMKANFLDLIPEKICQWEKAGDGRIFLLVPRFKNSLMKKIAQILKKSEIVKIKLESPGDQVWELINNKNTVEQIGKILGPDENETEDQMFHRLTEYISILARHRFISLHTN